MQKHQRVRPFPSMIDFALLLGALFAVALNSPH